MQMPGRKYQAASRYRYGFNGKEQDKDINEGVVAFEARIFDVRIARYFSVDPLSLEYDWQTTYAYHRNSPILLSDFLGMGDPPTSTQKEALDQITKLSKGLKQSKYFSKVSAEEFIKSLTDRVKNPDKMNQGEE